MPIVDPFDASSNKIVDPFESSSIVDPFAQEDEGATKAFFRGARQMVQGVGRTTGIVSPEDYTETYRKGKEAAQAHPIAAGLGQVAGVAAPVIGAALTAPVSVPLAGTALAASTAGAMMGGSEYARLKEERATPLETLQGADLASDVGTLGVLMPGGFGTTLTSRVGTGVASNVALGAGQRTVERDIIHKDRPDLQQDIFDPFAVAFDVAGGAVGGVATHVGAPKGVGKAEADIPEPVADHDSTTQIIKYLDDNEKDRLRTQYKIDQIQQDLNEHQFDTPEQAEQYHAARLEEVGQHQQALNELYASKENAEAMLRGETPQPKVESSQEMPIGQPPRPEGEFVRPEEAVVPKSEQVPDEVVNEYLSLLDERKELTPKVKDFENETTELNRLDEINSRIDDLVNEYPDVGDRSGSRADITHFTEALEAQKGFDPFEGKHPSYEAEEITIPPVERMDDLEFASDKEALIREQDALGAPLSLTGEAAARYRALGEQINRIEQTENTPKVYGGDASERATVQSVLDLYGLNKDNLDINLDKSVLSREDSVAEYTTVGDKGYVKLGSKEDILDYINTLPNLRKWFKGLAEGEQLRAMRMVMALHEVGHHLLNKLVQTDLFVKDSAFNKLLKDYESYLQKEGAITVGKEGSLYRDDVKGAQYYSKFPEFFAQYAAKVALTYKHDATSPIRAFTDSIQGAFNKLLEGFGLRKVGIGKSVEDFIVSLIKENENARKLGKTLWEMKNVRQSLETSHQWQNNFFPKKKVTDPLGIAPMLDHGVGKKDSPDFIGPPTVHTIALRHIEDANTVIKKMTGVEDVGGIASKIVAWRFGIQQRMGIYANNPVIKYASDVVLNSLHTQTQRSMELLSGVTDKATYLAKKGFGVTLKKIKDLDSPAVIFNKASNEDFHAIHQILEKGIGKYSYEESLVHFGTDLTPGQKDLYTAATKMYANMYKMSVDSAQRLGKKSVLPNMKGWYPAVRKGEFTVNFHIDGLKRLAGYDESGRAVMTDLSHSQSFRTRGEAEAFIKQFESQPAEFKGYLRHNGVEELGAKEGIDQLADFHRAYREQSEKLRKEFTQGKFELGEVKGIPEDLTWISAVDKRSLPKWLREELEGAKGDIQKVLDKRMQGVVDMYVARGGVLGGHARFRTNVSGSMGSEMFSTVHDAGKAFRDANYKSVDEFTGLMQKMEIEEKLNLLVNNEELLQSHPNTLEFVRLTRDYALNKVDSPLAFKGAKATIDALWEQAWKKTPLHKMEALGAKRYTDAPVVDIALRKMGSLFYIHALMSRPFFWGAQSIQGLWSLRTMLKDGAGPVSATVSAGKGMAQMLRPDKQFLEALYHTSQTSHTFDPQFIKDINSHALGDFMQEGSKGRLLFELITGEKQSTMADTFSRLMSYSMMYEHYKELGFKGEELANLAAKATDENMVQYGRQYKAPMYQKMGMLGDLVSPLHTFTNAALGNMISDVGEMLRAPGGKAKLRAALPFMATVAMTGLMTGILGTPLIAEYEALRLLINKLSNMLGGEDLLPSTVDWALSGDNTFSNRVVSHGLISASTMPLTDNQGLDIGASNRWQPIFDGITQGQDSFMQFIPVVNWYMQRAGDVETILGHATGIRPASEAERRAAAMNITPGWYKGIVDDLLFGAKDREMVPDVKGHALLPQTKTERAAKYLGGSTISSSVERLRQRRLKEQEMRDQPKINNLVARISDAVTRQDQETVQKLVIQLAKDYMVPEKIIESRVEKELVKRKVPKGMLQFVSPSGGMSTQQQQRYLKYQETYGTPDLEQYQSENLNENQ